MNKQQLRKSVERYTKGLKEVEEFLSDFKRVEKSLKSSGKYRTWIYEYSIIRVYVIFEKFILENLVGAINKDSSSLSNKTGISFPKHIAKDVCKYIVIRDGYFDFKGGRSGLIRELKLFLPQTHYLVETIKKDIYIDALDTLVAFRNYAAHSSEVSKRRAKKAVGAKRMPVAGAWLKKDNRLEGIISKLKDLAGKIEAAAPY